MRKQRTPDRPSDHQPLLFKHALGDFPGAKSWVSIDDGPKMLVVPLDNPEELIDQLPKLNVE